MTPAIDGDLRRRARELAALHQMAASLSSASNPDALVSTILDGARRVMSCDSAALYLSESLAEEIEPLASHGFTLEERRALNKQAASFLRARIRWSFGRPLRHPPDTSASPHSEYAATFRSDSPSPSRGGGGRGLGALSAPETRPDGRGVGAASLDGILWAPLVLDGQTIGALCLGGHQPGDLGPGEYGLATAIADYAAIAIANARLLRSNESSVRNLSTLSRVGQAVAESLQSQLVLQEIVRAAAEALTPSSTTVSLLNEERTEIVVAAVHLSSPAEDFRRRMPLHDSLAGWIIARAEPLAVPSSEASSMAQVSPSSSGFGILGGAGAPIFVQGKVIGALTAYTTSQRPYQQADLDLLQALAAQAAIAIEQASLHQSVIQEKAKLEAIVESLQDGLILVDTQERIAYVSQRFVELVGPIFQGRPDATIDRLWWRLIQDAADAEEARSQLAELDAQPATEITLTLARPTRRELAIRGLTVRADGNLVGRGYLLRDVTRQVEVERVKASILATVSHELRTPLAAIKGFASALLHEGMEWDRASQLDFLTQIDREADRLTGLVRNLLDMSRLEACTLRFEWEACDLGELVNDLLDRSASLVPDHRLQLNINTDDTRCVVDRRFLERVIWNLVENAAKYSPAGSEITVSIARDDSGILLSVTDRGVGIAPDERDRIFERFVRGSGVGSTGGCGLGLAICRAIVAVHDGTIAVESTPGEGSTFTVHLPIRPPSFPPTPDLPSFATLQTDLSNAVGSSSPSPSTVELDSPSPSQGGYPGGRGVGAPGVPPASPVHGDGFP
jgi:signal transduction histidine kinase